MLRSALIAAAAVWAGVLAADSGTAQAPSALVEARRAGIVGERFDGYLGYAATPSPQVRRQVGGINIRRRAIYTDLAGRRGVTVQLAGTAAGCALLSRVAVGESYMLPDGVWRRRAAGQPSPRPPHCGSG